MADFLNRVITWDVPFEKGTLKATAKINGKPVADYELKTTGKPVKIIASCSETTLKADRNGLAHLFVSVCDDAGNTVYQADNEITCAIEGPVHLLGMEDSNPSNTENYKDNRQHVFRGKLLIYLQSTDNQGTVKIKLTSPELEDATIDFVVIK